MSVAIFKVDTISDAETKVVHLEEGHWYKFYIVADKNGRRILSDGSYREAASAKHSAQYFVGDAKRFAEMEARKRGKID